MLREHGNPRQARHAVRRLRRRSHRQVLGEEYCAAGGEGEGGWGLGEGKGGEERYVSFFAIGD